MIALIFTFLIVSAVSVQGDRQFYATASQYSNVSLEHFGDHGNLEFLKVIDGWLGTSAFDQKNKVYYYSGGSNIIQRFLVDDIKTTLPPFSLSSEARIHNILLNEDYTNIYVIGQFSSGFQLHVFHVADGVSKQLIDLSAAGITRPGQTTLDAENGILYYVYNQQRGNTTQYDVFIASFSVDSGKKLNVVEVKGLEIYSILDGAVYNSYAKNIIVVSLNDTTYAPAISYVDPSTGNFKPYPIMGTKSFLDGSLNTNTQELFLGSILNGGNSTIDVWSLKSNSFVAQIGVIGWIGTFESY